MGDGILIESREEEIIIKNIIANRGKCKYPDRWFLDPFRHRDLGKGIEDFKKLRNNYKMGFGDVAEWIFEQCSSSGVIEIEVETNKGNYIYNFE